MQPSNVLTDIELIQTSMQRLESSSLCCDPKRTDNSTFKLTCSHGRYLWITFYICEIYLCGALQEKYLINLQVDVQNNFLNVYSSLVLFFVVVFFVDIFFIVHSSLVIFNGLVLLWYYKFSSLYCLSIKHSIS